jgi:hypothetical protein
MYGRLDRNPVNPLILKIRVQTLYGSDNLPQIPAYTQSLQMPAHCLNWDFRDFKDSQDFCQAVQICRVVGDRYEQPEHKSCESLKSRKSQFRQCAEKCRAQGGKPP